MTPGAPDDACVFAGPSRSRAWVYFARSRVAWALLA